MTTSLRRYALRKRREADAVGDYAIRDVWKAKQEEIPGTDLPVSFPSRARLACLFYVAIEDLSGADEEELTTLGFSNSEAAAILTAASQEISA